MLLRIWYTLGFLLFRIGQNVFGARFNKMSFRNGTENTLVRPVLIFWVMPSGARVSKGEDGTARHIRLRRRVGSVGGACGLYERCMVRAHCGKF